MGRLSRRNCPYCQEFCYNRGVTKLAEEKRKKRKSAKAAEKILTIGEKGKKGVKYAKQVFKEEGKKAKAERAIELETLQKGRRGRIVTYNRLLAKLLLKRLTFVDWPLGWTYQVAPTKVGVVLEMKSPGGRFFRSGFKSTSNPLFDLNAINIYAVRAENTIDRISGADAQKTASGIIIPGGVN